MDHHYSPPSRYVGGGSISPRMYENRINPLAQTQPQRIIGGGSNSSNITTATTTGNNIITGASGEFSIKPDPGLAATDSEIVGIGLIFVEGVANNRICVLTLVNHSPAQRDGSIQPGDLVVSVDGVNVIGMKLAAVRNRVVGAPGTKCHLVFERPSIGGATFAVTLTRESKSELAAREKSEGEMLQRVKTELQIEKEMRVLLEGRIREMENSKNATIGNRDEVEKRLKTERDNLIAQLDQYRDEKHRLETTVANLQSELNTRTVVNSSSEFQAKQTQSLLQIETNRRIALEKKVASLESQLQAKPSDAQIQLLDKALVVEKERRLRLEEELERTVESMQSKTNTYNASMHAETEARAELEEEVQRLTQRGKLLEESLQCEKEMRQRSEEAHEKTVAALRANVNDVHERLDAEMRRRVKLEEESMREIEGLRGQMNIALSELDEERHGRLVGDTENVKLRERLADVEMELRSYRGTPKDAMLTIDNSKMHISALQQQVTDAEVEAHTQRAIAETLRKELGMAKKAEETAQQKISELRSELGRTLHDSMTDSQQVSILSQQLEANSSSLSSLHDRIHKLQQENQTLTNDKNALSDECSSLHTQVHTLQSQISGLKADLEHNNHRLTDTTSSEDQLRRRYQQLEQEYHNIKSEYIKAEAVIHMETMAKNETLASLAAFRSQLAETNAAREAAGRQCEELEHLLGKAKLALLKKIQTREMEDKRSVETSNALQVATRNASYEAMNWTKEREDFALQVAQLQEEVSVKSEAENQLRKQLSLVTATVASMEARVQNEAGIWAGEMENMRQQLSKAKIEASEAVVRLNNEIQQRESSENKVRTLVLQLRDLHDEVDRGKAAMETMHALIKKLEAELEESQILCNEAKRKQNLCEQSAQRSTSALHESIKGLERQLEESFVIQSEQEKQILSLKEQIRRYEGDISSVQFRLQQTGEERDHYIKQRSILENTIEQLNERIQGYDAAMKEAEEKYHKSEQTREKLGDQIADLLQENKEMKTKISEAEKALNGSIENAKRLENELGIARLFGERTSDEFAELQKEKVRMEVQLHDRMGALEQEYSVAMEKERIAKMQLQHELQGVNDDFAAARQTIKKLETELGISAQRNHELEMMERELQREIQQLSGARESMQYEVEEVRHQFNAHKEEMQKKVSEAVATAEHERKLRETGIEELLSHNRSLESLLEAEKTEWSKRESLFKVQLLAERENRGAAELECHQLANELRSLTASLEEESTLRLTNEKETSRIRNELDSEKQTVQNLREENKRKLAEIHKLEEDIGDLKNSRVSLEQELRKVKADHVTASEELKLERAAKTAVEQELEKERDARMNAEETLHMEKVARGAVEEELQHERIARSTIEEELARRGQGLRQVEADIEREKANYQRMNEELNAAKMAIERERQGKMEVEERMKQEIDMIQQRQVQVQGELQLMNERLKTGLETEREQHKATQRLLAEVNGLVEKERLAKETLIVEKDAAICKEREIAVMREKEARQRLEGDFNSQKMDLEAELKRLEASKDQMLRKEREVRAAIEEENARLISELRKCEADLATMGQSLKKEVSSRGNVERSLDEAHKSRLEAEGILEQETAAKKAAEDQVIKLTGEVKKVTNEMNAMRTTIDNQVRKEKELRLQWEQDTSKMNEEIKRLEQMYTSAKREAEREAARAETAEKEAQLAFSDKTTSINRLGDLALERERALKEAEERVRKAEDQKNVIIAEKRSLESSYQSLAEHARVQGELCNKMQEQNQIMQLRCEDQEKTMNATKQRMQEENQAILGLLRQRLQQERSNLDEYLATNREIDGSMTMLSEVQSKVESIKNQLDLRRKERVQLQQHSLRSIQPQPQQPPPQQQQFASSSALFASSASSINPMMASLFASHMNNNENHYNYAGGLGATTTSSSTSSTPTVPASNANFNTSSNINNNNKTNNNFNNNNNNSTANENNSLDTTASNPLQQSLISSTIKSQIPKHAVYT